MSKRFLIAIALTLLPCLPVRIVPNRIAGQEKRSTIASKQSPASERIVFAISDQTRGIGTGPAGVATVNDPGLKVDLTKRHIGMVNADGSSFVDLKIRGSDPAFSPDGTQIAFCSKQNTNYAQLFVAQSDGRDLHQLTHLDGGDAGGPVWAPDGKRIAFYAFKYPNPNREPNLYVVDADGKDVKLLAEHASEPTWSSDGSRIAFTSSVGGHFDIASIRVDGTDRKQLTKNAGENSSPAWSPDGTTIAFVSDRKGSQALYLMNPDGSEVQRFIFSTRARFCFPAWSRDGRTLAFTSLVPSATQFHPFTEEQPKCESWLGEYEIYSVGPDGKNPRLLVSSKISGLHPSYGP